MVAVISRTAVKEIGIGVYYPLTDSKNYNEPNGTGITTKCRAELAAIVGAITHYYAHRNQLRGGGDSQSRPFNIKPVQRSLDDTLRTLSTSNSQLLPEFFQILISLVFFLAFVVEGTIVFLWGSSHRSFCAEGKNKLELHCGADFK
eukprot:1158553-Pelagomonas_calceolata.AAC.10